MHSLRQSLRTVFLTIGFVLFVVMAYRASLTANDQRAVAGVPRFVQTNLPFGLMPSQTSGAGQSAGGTLQLVSSSVAAADRPLVATQTPKKVDKSASRDAQKSPGTVSAKVSKEASVVVSAESDSGSHGGDSGHNIENKGKHE